MHRPQIDTKVPQRFRPQRMLLLALCWTTLAGVIWLMALAAEREQIAPPLTLKGSLEQETAQQDLTLGAHIPVSEVLVQNGDLLSRGQAVLHYDTDILQAELVELHTTIQTNQRERQCLLTPRPKKPATPEISPLAPDASAEGEIRLTNALNRCQTIQTTQALARSELEHHIASLHQRLRLQQHRAGTTLAHLSGQDLISSQMAQEIAERTLLIEVEHHKIELQKLISTQKRVIADQIRGLTNEYDTLKTRRAAIEALLNDPFLRSPQAGTLTRQRTLHPGSRFDMDITVAQVISEGDDYTATAQVDAEIAQALSEGDTAFFRISGLPLRAPAVPAKIATITLDKGHLSPVRRYNIRFQLTPHNIVDPHWKARVIRYFSVMDGKASAQITLTAAPIRIDLQRRIGQLFRSPRNVAADAPTSQAGAHRSKDTAQRTDAAGFQPAWLEITPLPTKPANGS